MMPASSARRDHVARARSCTGSVRPCGFEVEEADVDDLGVEDLLDLVADEVVHRLHVELGGEALLDAVDDRQLGGALVRLGQQALRLVEEPRVLERDAQARGERRQQPNVALSLKACSRSRFWSEMNARPSSPRVSGTKTARLGCLALISESGLPNSMAR